MAVPFPAPPLRPETVTSSSSTVALQTTLPSVSSGLTSPTSQDASLQGGYSASSWTAAYDPSEAQVFSPLSTVEWTPPETFRHPHVRAILEQDDGLK